MRRSVETMRRVTWPFGRRYQPGPALSPQRGQWSAPAAAEQRDRTEAARCMPLSARLTPLRDDAVALCMAADPKLGSRDCRGRVCRHRARSFTSSGSSAKALRNRRVTRDFTAGPASILVVREPDRADLTRSPRAAGGHGG